MDRYIAIGDITIGKGNKYVFDDISDISSGSAKSQVTEFLNTDGVIYSNTTFEPREFKIKGTILASDLEELKQLKFALTHTCNPKSQKMIYYFDGFEKYQANVYFSGNVEYAPRKKYSMAFIIYVVLPSFYWEVANTTHLPVCKRADEFTTSFTLPCIFTSKTTETQIYNDTEMDIFPVVRIKINTASVLTTLKVKNETTQEEITLSGYTFSSGEIITIDTYEYKAYSTNTANLLNYLNDFEQWKIIPGKNILKGYNGTNLVDADIEVIYNKKVIGV